VGEGGEGGEGRDTRHGVEFGHVRSVCCLWT